MDKKKSDKKENDKGKRYKLTSPKVVAIAQDKYLTPSIVFKDTVYLPANHSPKYGQDITRGLKLPAPRHHSTQHGRDTTRSRKIRPPGVSIQLKPGASVQDATRVRKTGVRQVIYPRGHDAANARKIAPLPGYSVGDTAKELKPKMEKLLNVFARGDKKGLSRRLFARFLQKQSAVTYFEDPDLNALAASHENIRDFCSFALSAPNSPKKATGKIRIHQALEKAGWDINKIKVPTDLGVPAFNKGSAFLQTGDFNNGLGLMINGVQYVYVVALSYLYEEKQSKYAIKLRFIFYDVFGLDDDDLREFGTKSAGSFSFAAPMGITAWWQLQHEHGYAPLVTRIVIDKRYEVKTE